MGVPSSVQEHYELERQLAARLRNADKSERRTLYSSLYDELFRRLPEHPQLKNKVSPEQTAQRTAAQMELLGRFLQRDLTFAEIGPGDCALSFHVAPRVRQVYAIDVSDEITRCANPPTNFRLLLSDGTSIPLPPGSIDVIYSNQLMEHLHPDDAEEQLQNIFAALKVGGTYVCITPSRLTGPHDVSRYFDPVATGFHLKEYSTSELTALMRRAGFRRIRAAVGGKGRFLWVSPKWIAPVERMLDLCPPTLRRSLARSRAFRWLLGGRVCAQK